MFKWLQRFKWFKNDSVPLTCNTTVPTRPYDAVYNELEDKLNKMNSIVVNLQLKGTDTTVSPVHFVESFSEANLTFKHILDSMVNVVDSEELISKDVFHLMRLNLFLRKANLMQSKLNAVGISRLKFNMIHHLV